jgi:hypothetical protein
LLTNIVTMIYFFYCIVANEVKHVTCLRYNSRNSYDLITNYIQAFSLKKKHYKISDFNTCIYALAPYDDAVHSTLCLWIPSIVETLLLFYLCVCLVVWSSHKYFVLSINANETRKENARAQSKGLERAISYIIRNEQVNA